jgi:biopolymer transport protein ExbD
MAMINTSEGAQGKVRRVRASTHIDMTPMVDLAFLLLTFFMLTTSFYKPYTQVVDMPEKADIHTVAPVIPDEKALTLVLGEHNKIFAYMGQPGAAAPKVTDYSANGIRKFLHEKMASVKGLYVFVKPSSKSRYQNVIDIMDEIVITGVERYAIVKITPEDSKLMSAVH